MERIRANIITGFLGSGKTTYINHLFSHGRLRRGTVILSFEHGESDYLRNEFGDQDILVLDMTNNEKGLPASLESVRHKFSDNNIDYEIIIEMNGFYMLRDKIPELSALFDICSVTTIINCAAFDLYYKNMPQYLTDKLLFSRSVIVNRMEANDSSKTMDSFWHLLSISAPVASVSELTSAGDLIPLSDPGIIEIPDGDPIVISDDEYFLMYRLICSHPDLFKGRIIQVSADCSEIYTDGFTISRYLLVCCPQDIVMAAFLCYYTSAADIAPGSSVRVTAQVEYSPIDGSPVLLVKDILPCLPVFQEL